MCLLHLVENGCLHSSVMMRSNFLALKVDQVRCRRRLSYTCSQAGSCPLASGMFNICLLHITWPDATKHTSTEPPFDRHDWVVRRPKSGEEVRYIIDYYSAPPEANGSPVFSLDVRPALDDFSSVKDRIAFATQDVWSSFRQNSNQPPSTFPQLRLCICCHIA
jgi:hypothetical protein